MQAIEWARSVKADLAQLEQATGIPALWAAAQMCHESAVDGGEGLSQLATDHHNYAGMKWAQWQAEYGCAPVNMATWEVLDGTRQDVEDAFCHCQDWATWLKVYGALLGGRYYAPAMDLAADPLLFGWGVWHLGWATDPAYLVGVAGWMARLLPDYADTLPHARQEPVNQVAASVDPPPAPSDKWDPVAEIARLKDRGLIKNIHAPGEQVTWAQLATIVNRIHERGV